ncbi:MAG: preprotein translocase subunit YajC [Phycisphaerales bacterium]|nr:preprotein translocase subunit YajC [Phycisphaerales bacterium]
MLDSLLMLAQTTTAPAGGQPPAQSGWDAFFRFYFPLLAIFAVFWWMMSRGQRRERDKYQQMLAALKRGDRVLTIGGIIGTIVEVRDNEAVLKIDEAANVKMRVVRSAIKDIFRDQPGTTPTVDAK